MFRTSLLVAIAAISMIGAGCKKKVAVAPPPPPAQSAPSTAPTTTQPATRERAATTPAPTATTPQSRYPDAATRARINQLLTKFEDAYFDYDKHYLRPDAVKALEADSTELRDILAKYPDYKLTIEGHCDERGSEEYNIGLGDARAKAAKDYLVRVGVTADQLAVVSYGKDRPICQDHDEACWQKNRRVAVYGEFNGLFDIDTLEMIEGDLPPRARKMVKDWARTYRGELMKMWKKRDYKQLPGLE